MTALLSQSAALMITGMVIVFGMLIALIGVIALNARVVARFKLETPAQPAPPPPKSAAMPVVAVIAAAIKAHEDFSNSNF